MSLFYNRDRNIDLTNAPPLINFDFNPGYGSSITFSCKKNTYGFQNFTFTSIPLTLNNITAKCNFNFVKNENEAQSIINFFESQLGTGAFGINDSSNIYRTLTGYADEFSIQMLNNNMYSIGLEFNVERNSSALQWKGMSFVNYDFTEWKTGQTYKKYQPIYFPFYQRDKTRNFFYCTDDHVSTLDNAPLSDDAPWTKSLFYENDFGLSIPTKPKVEMNYFKNSFTQRTKGQENIHVFTELQLSYQNISVFKLKSMLHFLENSMGVKRFKFDLPQIYNKSKCFMVETWQHTWKYKDSNDLSISLVEDPLGIVNPHDSPSIKISALNLQDKYPVQFEAVTGNIFSLTMTGKTITSTGISGNYALRDELLTSNSLDPYQDDVIFHLNGEPKPSPFVYNSINTRETVIADKSKNSLSLRSRNQSVTNSTIDPKFGKYSINFVSNLNPTRSYDLLFDGYKGFRDGYQGSIYIDFISNKNFTIEYWIKTNKKPFSLIKPYAIAGNLFHIKVSDAGFLNWDFIDRTNNSISTLYSVDASSILNNNWHHVAHCKSGSTHKLFFDGIQQASVTDNNFYADNLSLLSIGNDIDNFSDGFFSGQLDELRITKDIARYFSNFTPPASAFPEYLSYPINQEIKVYGDLSKAYIQEQVKSIEFFDGCSMQSGNFYVNEDITFGNVSNIETLTINGPATANSFLNLKNVTGVKSFLSPTKKFLGADITNCSGLTGLSLSLVTGATGDLKNILANFSDLNNRSGYFYCEGPKVKNDGLLYINNLDCNNWTVYLQEGLVDLPMQSLKPNYFNGSPSAVLWFQSNPYNLNNDGNWRDVLNQYSLNSNLPYSSNIIDVFLPSENINDQFGDRTPYILNNLVLTGGSLPSTDSRYYGCFLTMKFDKLPPTGTFQAITDIITNSNIGFEGLYLAADTDNPTLGKIFYRSYRASDNIIESASIIGTNTIVPGEYYSIGFIRDGTSASGILNGQVVSTNTLMSRTALNNLKLTLGGRYWNNGATTLLLSQGKIFDFLFISNNSPITVGSDFQKFLGTYCAKYGIQSTLFN